MPKPRSDVLTEAEQRIMRVIWDKGEASVRDVTDALEDSYPVVEIRGAWRPGYRA